MFGFILGFWFCFFAALMVSPAFVQGDAFDDEVEVLPIVYLYTLQRESESCSNGIPAYILTTLEQALVTQGSEGVEVVFASNYRDCKGAIKSLRDSNLASRGLVMVDIDEVASADTKKFIEGAEAMLHIRGIWEPLYAHSLTRFLYLLDLMKYRNYQYMMHMEADNMLYGKLVNLLPLLRGPSYNKGVAATPLTDNECLMTASALWVPNLAAMEHFTSFFKTMVSVFFVYQDLDKIYPPGLNWKPDDLEQKIYHTHHYAMPAEATTEGPDIFTEYIETMGRRCACCRDNGTFPDKHNHGKTIKPHFVNEMSLMSFYRQLHPDRMAYFPVLPSAKYVENRWVGSMQRWSTPKGSKIAGPTLDGVWDPNSWGQRLGGTSRGKDDIGFTDPTHIIAQGILVTICRIKMRCANPQSTKFMNKVPSETAAVLPSTFVDEKTGTTNTTCWTQPMVSCGHENRGKWWPLWNLHVHSKKSHLYVSKHCSCIRVKKPKKQVNTANGTLPLPPATPEINNNHNNSVAAPAATAVS